MRCACASCEGPSHKSHAVKQAAQPLSTVPLQGSAQHLDCPATRLEASHHLLPCIPPNSRRFCPGLDKSTPDASQDNSKAARLLAEHGHVTGAVKRLMRPLHKAAQQGHTLSPNWADKDTLKQLYTYCTSLNSQWALQQVLFP